MYRWACMAIQAFSFDCLVQATFLANNNITTFYYAIYIMQGQDHFDYPLSQTGDYCFTQYTTPLRDSSQGKSVTSDALSPKSKKKLF